MRAALLLVVMSWQDPELPVGKPVEGRITAESPAITSRTLERRFGEGAIRRQAFEVKVGEKGEYAIELQSKAFDPWLVVRDPAGKLLAEVTGTRERPAVVVVAIEKGARIEACALHGGEGAFTLRCTVASAVERRQATLAPLWAAVQQAELRHGAEAEEVARKLNLVGHELWKQGRYAEALPVMQRQLQILERIHGPEHERTAFGLSLVAAQLQGLGRYGEMEPLYRRALAIREKVLGSEHPGVARSLNSLAALLVSQARYAEAEPLYRRALAILEKVSPPEHQGVASCLNNLAVLLVSQARHAEAEPLCRRALAIWEKLHGPEHPSVATGLGNLADLLGSQGKNAEAEPLNRRALAILEQVHGPEHPDVAERLSSVAMHLLHAQGKDSEAEPLLRRALAIREKVHGPEHPDVAKSLSNLAELLRSQGKSAEGEPLCRRALAILEKVHGPGHPGVADVLNNLAALLGSHRKYSEAESLLRRALAIQEKLHGPDHPQVARTLNNLAMFLKAQARYGEAEPLCRQALAIVEKVHGSEHPRVAKGLDNLAALLRSQGRYAEAEPLCRRALAIVEKLHDPEHPDLAWCLDNLLHVLADSGHMAEAWDLGNRLCDAGMGQVLRELGLAPGDDRFRISADQANRLVHLLSCLTNSTDIEARLDRAWRHVTAWKGVVFRLSRRVAATSSAEASTPRERLRSLSDQLTRLAYAREIQELAGHRRRFEDLLAERRKVQAELMKSLGIEPGREVTDARELGRLLPEKSALLDFVVHSPLRFARSQDGKVVEPERWEEPRVLCFVVRAGAERPLLVDLGKVKELRALTGRWLSLLAPGQRGDSLGGTGPDPRPLVREALWDPLAKHLTGVDLVFVCADDVLAQVPFGAIEVAKGRYAIELAQFVAVQDPVTLREQLETAATARARSSSLLALGAVDYRSRAAVPKDVAAASQRGARGFDREWKALDFTGAEIDAVRTLFAAQQPGQAPLLLRGADATEEAFALAARGKTILHLATHGWFEKKGVASLWESALVQAHEAESKPLAIGTALDERKPIKPLEGEPPGLLSGLVLAGANEKPPAGRADGLLTADEVAGLDLKGCELAVLSACETELGSYRSGEGLLGLRRAFAEAGARTVVSTLWRVDDAATRVLIERFYQGLWQEKLSPAQALRAAQLALLRGESRSEYREPRYWAAWLVAGEWR